MALRYGNTDVVSTADEYRFDCGNCHPIDAARHRDGVVDVELYDAEAPPGSLKAKNPLDAAYNPGTGTCGNVYCHSGPSFSSSTVGPALTYPASPVPPGSLLNDNSGASKYIMDATCSNLTYAPYTVTFDREYVETPAWGTTGTLTACDECHGFPITTYWPDVTAGVGDSHQFVDSNGWNWRHAWNMDWFSFGAVACRTCHVSTVTETGATDYGPYGRNGEWIVVYDPVPLASRVTHVNGVPDVAFDTVNPVEYRTSLSLIDATYDPQTKTCSDVICHYKPTGTATRWQKVVPWGGPWRDWEANSNGECDVCHRYGTINDTCSPPP